MVTELMQIRVLLLPQMAAVLRQNHHRYVAANTQSGSKGVVGLEPSGKSALALRSLGLLGPMMGTSNVPVSTSTRSCTNPYALRYLTTSRHHRPGQWKEVTDRAHLP